MIGHKDLEEKEISLTTFKSLDDNHQKFVQILNSDRLKGKLSKSVVNESLINGKDGQTVLSICAIPELHEMEGLANHILYNGIYPKFGNEVVDGIIKDMGIKVNFFYGASLNGNNSKKLLDKADELLNYVDKETMQPFVDALKSVGRIVDTAFNSNVQDEENTSDIVEAVAAAQHAVSNANLSITLKAHVLYCHLIEALQFSKGQNLGYMSEQCGEASHHDFSENFWKRFLTSESSYSYPSSLLKAVIEFSSEHI